MEGESNNTEEDEMRMKMRRSRQNEDRMTDDRERSRVASRYQCSDDYDIGGSFKQPSPWLSSKEQTLMAKQTKTFFRPSKSESG